MVGTFKALCNLADFGTSVQKTVAAGASNAHKEPGIDKAGPAVAVEAAAPGISNDMTVNINIQLQVPADATGEIYEKFFAAMRKHLWPEK